MSETSTYSQTFTGVHAYKYIVQGATSMTVTKPLPRVGLIDNGEVLLQR